MYFLMEQLVNIFKTDLNEGGFESDCNISCQEFESSDHRFQSRYYYLKNGIIKCTAKGSITIETALQAQRFFNDYLGILKSKKQTGPYYLVMDMRQVKGADKEARNYLYLDTKSLFENGTLAFATVIQPNAFVRTIGKIWLKLSSKINYSFHKTEAEAYQALLTKKFRDQEATLKTDYVMSELNDLKSRFEQDFIMLNGKKYPVYSKPSWKFHTDQSEIYYYLINSNIILCIASGKLTKQAWNFCMHTLRDIVQTSGQTNLTLILEGSKMASVSLEVKRSVLLFDQEISQFIHRKYFILSSVHRVLLRIFHFTHPKFVKSVVLSSSIQEAITGALIHKELSQDLGTTIPPWRKDPTKLKLMSKRELINHIKDSEELQQDRMNTMFEIFGRITWDKSFQPDHLEINENDPYFDLFNGVNLLQDDVYSMIKELRDLNQQLENKVRTRTTELQRKNRDLVKVNQELDSLVYRVAHDLRSPLASLTGIINLLNQEKDQAQKEQLNQLVHQSIGKMNQFINENIELSRGNTAKQNRVDFKGLIDEILSETNFMKNARGMVTEIKMTQSTDFKTDLTKLKVILRNLISNSIKYKSPERTLKLIFEVKKANGEQVVNIRDNGIGISCNNLQKVFNKFYRVDNGGEGSGLGLHIVKDMMDKLQGRIDINSVPGEGTCVSLIFTS